MTETGTVRSYIPKIRANSRDGAPAPMPIMRPTSNPLENRMTETDTKMADPEHVCPVHICPHGASSHYGPVPNVEPGPFVWMSFIDPTRPVGERFLWAAVSRLGEFPAEMKNELKRLRSLPTVIVHELPYADPPVEIRGRILSRAEAEKWAADWDWQTAAASPIGDLSREWINGRVRALSCDPRAITAMITGLAAELGTDRVTLLRGMLSLIRMGIDYIAEFSRIRPRKDDEARTHAIALAVMRRIAGPDWDTRKGWKYLTFAAPHDDPDGGFLGSVVVLGNTLDEAEDEATRLGINPLVGRPAGGMASASIYFGRPPSDISNRLLGLAESEPVKALVLGKMNSVVMLGVGANAEATIAAARVVAAADAGLMSPDDEAAKATFCAAAGDPMGIIDAGQDGEV
jgi:hypothetical protein